MASPLGWPDWQRLGAFDGPDFVSNDALTVNAQVILGPFSVSRWARLAGRFRSATGVQAFEIQWSDTQNFASLVGSRGFNLDSTTSSQQMHVQFPNLGPWVRVVIQPFLAGTVGINLFGSNRQQPLEVIPAMPTLISLNGVAVVSGVTRTDPIQNFYSGRAQLWILPQAAFSLVALDVLDNGASYRTFFQVSNPTANVDINTNIEWPLGQVRVRAAQATGAPQTYFIVVTPGGAGA